MITYKFIPHCPKILQKKKSIREANIKLKPFTPIEFIPFSSSHAQVKLYLKRY